ncbi:MAG: HDOD domain-containing protein [Betaproteobacteria bacterium]|nr:HDOD domain-containing protein [Betaproteobacteria bacterium]
MDIAKSNSLEAWVDKLSRSEIPVLRRTAEQLGGMRADLERVSVRQAATVVQNDPLMTCRLLVHVARLRRGGSATHDIETTEQALLMIGVVRFLETFAGVVTVEQTLGERREALVGALRVAGRSRHAARLAVDWAVFRNDLHVFEIATAALLHDIAELMAWIYAPETMLRVDEVCKANPRRRTADIQAELFGFTFNALKLALNRAWQAPEYLVELMDDEVAATHPSHLTVRLASSLARHAQRGWDNPAIPDDLRGVSELLKIPVSAVAARLGIEVPPGIVEAET